MVSSTRTPSAIAHSSHQSKAVLITLRPAVLSMAIAAAVEPASLTAAQLMREEVESLCSHMLWLRNWWEAHGDGIRAADRKAAAGIHDHFIDGAMFARGIARQAGFDLDEERMRNYGWGRSTQTLRMVFGGAQ